MLAATLALAVLASVAYVNQATEGPGTKMASAADKFLGSLSAELKDKATFEFSDKERINERPNERFNWHFIPLENKDTRKSTRKGVPFEALSKEQREAAL